MQHSHKQEVDATEMCNQADEQLDSPDLFEQKWSPGDILKLVVQGMECLHVSRR